MGSRKGLLQVENGLRKLSFGFRVWGRTGFRADALFQSPNLKDSKKLGSVFPKGPCAQIVSL